MPPESPIVRALTPHPTEPHTIYAGLINGLWRSKDSARTKSGWEKVSASSHDLNIWCVAIDSTDPDTVFVGTSPAAIFRSRDGGHRFEMLTVPNIASWCDTGTIRVVRIAIDPDNSKNIFAGLEVDGVRRSLDGGNTWEYIEGSWPKDNPDLHDMAFVKVNGTTKILATTNDEIHVSTDMGESWEPMGLKESITNSDTRYVRWLVIKPDDPQTMFVAVGNGAVGTTGGVFRTRNGGETWDQCQLPDKPKATMYELSTHPAAPDWVAGCTCNGEVYVSEDLGDSWRKSERLFGETTCIRMHPSTGLPTSINYRD